MSVNKFGSNSSKKLSNNKTYVDSKFITLTNHLQTKADIQYVDEMITQTIENVIKHVDATIRKAIGNLDVISKSSVEDLINMKFENRKLSRQQQKRENQNLSERRKSQ